MKTGYIIRNGNEYLVARRERRTGSGQWEKVYSMHRYDAARIPDKREAQIIIRKITEAGDEWHMEWFNPLTGEVRPA